MGRRAPASRWGEVRTRGRVVTALLGTALLATAALAAAAPVSSPRPTLVLILTDDQRHDTLAYMPILQHELIASGITFSHAFATTPLCCPSRASLLRGQYASRTGVLTNASGGRLDPEARWPGGVSAFRDRSTLATWLRAAGYRTGLFGKYLNGYRPGQGRPPGWDEWYALGPGGYYDYTLDENGTVRRFGRQPADYGTDVLVGRAVRFIEEGGTAPLFVYFAPFAPHSPATPHLRDRGTFADLPPWRPPGYNEADVSDKPAWVRRLPLLGPRLQHAGDVFRRDQLRALRTVDRAIGQLVDALRRTGRLADSLIVFTSDNGLSWGEHRWLGEKSCPYEECIRVPLVVRLGRVAGGREDPRFALNIDIAPLFLELAGAEADLPLDGRSLTPLLRGAEHPWRSEVLLEYWGPRELTWLALRTIRWKYVEYENGDRELYDLVADVHELTNAIAQPAHREVVAGLRRRLDALRPDRWRGAARVRAPDGGRPVPGPTRGP